MRGSRSATLAVARTQCAAKPTGPPVLGHTLLPGPLGTEETMKRQWHVRREAVERPDAQGRWDRAYQSLLRWSLENEQEAMSKLALRARTARRSTMRVAAYVRVSTSRQVKLETIEQQLEMVRRHAQEQGWELAGGGHLPRRRLQRHDAEAPRPRRPARQGADAGARGRRGAIPGSAGAQLRPPDGPHRGVREGRLPGGVRGEADEFGA